VLEYEARAEGLCFAGAGKLDHGAERVFSVIEMAFVPAATAPRPSG